LSSTARESLAANLLSSEGEGFKIAMRILDRSRPGVGAQGLGIAQGATDYALEYAKTRETMGRPIAQHQLIQAKLADMETRCEAARGILFFWNATRFALRRAVERRGSVGPLRDIRRAPARVKGVQR
jgi:alkylation response protein AidB-like acyl-CoA dehydrogenase